MFSPGCNCKDDTDCGAHKTCKRLYNKACGRCVINGKSYSLVNN